MRRHFAALAALFAATAVHAADSRPNVLLITADDLGLQLSCYGERRITTPRIDALAAQGVRFTHGYVTQASCSSSRASLLTGRFPHQNGQVGLQNRGFSMHPGQRTLPALLKAAGYLTGIVGKLHVDPADAFPFDVRPGKADPEVNPTRNVQWIATQARTFFVQAKSSGQPFFYYANYFDPHGPLGDDTDRVNGLPAKTLRAADIAEPLPDPRATLENQRLKTARLFNTILRLDAGIGLLLDALEAEGMASNTLVIFVGDNGLDWPRGKMTAYELGLRVPFIVRWPAVASAGQVRTELVSLLDVMPTALAAAGARIPADLGGQPLQPLLRGETVTWREYLFGEMNFHTQETFRPQRTVRDARHKLMLQLTPGAAPEVSLYDLSTDPWETKDIAASPELAATRRRLEAALQAWREDTHDPLLDPARVQRWAEASRGWGAKLEPSTKAGGRPRGVLTARDLELLK